MNCALEKKKPRYYVQNFKSFEDAVDALKSIYSNVNITERELLNQLWKNNTLKEIDKL